MSMRTTIAVLLTAAAIFVVSLRRAMASAPEQHLPITQYTAPKNVDTPRTFPIIAGRAEWEKRRASLRLQAQVSCGLYPLFERTPLEPHVFDRVERDGYTVEKVAIQTHPGFYLAGNLYRPFGPKTAQNHGATQGARYPGILVAHGHFEQGRMVDEERGCIAARAITFARMGCVAFSYDMVGFNDTRQLGSHYGVPYAADRAHWLWGVNLMGLQTWNSLRALDFLAALPDVDTARLAITGESGGGTQTMMLAAIDDRLAATGPCVMVSHSMQGGCLCENAPGLRIEYSNMEIAASAAPKPQVMVGATGDWTKTMLTIEGPAVKRVYRLYGAEDHLRYDLFDFGHNINRTSRNAVYQFFGKMLLRDPNSDAYSEPPYKMEPVADLRVFPDSAPLPANAKTPEQLTEYLKNLGTAQFQKAMPTDADSLDAFKKRYRPLWEHTLVLALPEAGHIDRLTDMRVRRDDLDLQSVTLPRPEGGPPVPVQILRPVGSRPLDQVVILISPKGSAAFSPQTSALVRSLLKHGVTVALPELFLQPGRYDAASAAARTAAMDTFKNYFTTYNRTDLQERVQELALVADYLRKHVRKRVTLYGAGQAGLWAMLAAPLVDRVAADCDQVDLASDEPFLTDALFLPGFRRMGDFRTALTLAAPHPLLLHNTAGRFTSEGWLQSVYAAVGAQGSLRIGQNVEPEEELINWLAGKQGGR